MSTTARNPWEELGREKKAHLLCDALERSIQHRFRDNPHVDAAYLARLVHSQASAASTNHACRLLLANLAEVPLPSDATMQRVVEIAAERRAGHERVARHLHAVEVSQ